MIWKWFKKKPALMPAEAPTMNPEEKKEVMVDKKPDKKPAGLLINRTALRCLRCGCDLILGRGQIAFYCKKCRKEQRGGKRNRRLIKRQERKEENE